MDDGSILIITWVLSGYIGAVWLMAKGYTGELIGCVIMAGGAPLLVPATMGPLFLIGALLLPKKETKVTSDTNITIQDSSLTTVGGEINIGKVNKTITQLRSEGQSDLASALDRLKDAVIASQHLDPEQKTQQVDVIVQIAEEAAKDNPNRLLLKGLTDALISALKTVPDVTKAITSVAPLLTVLAQHN